MIDKIENLIKDIMIGGRDDEKFKQLVEQVIFFGLKSAERREKYDKNNAWLDFEWAKYHTENKENHKSDLACKNQFKVDFREKIFTIDKVHAESRLMDSKLRCYEKYIDFLKGQDIKDMHIAKMTG